MNNFRVFSRRAWQKNPSWPDGYEPLATPQDKCRTIRYTETESEARTICNDHNAERPTGNKGRHEFNYYEFTSV